MLGLLLGLLALAFVLYPILRPERAAAGERSAWPELEERRGSIYRQIIELEFDAKLGKVSGDDARELTASLLREAAELLAAQSTSERDVEAQIEREIAALRRAMAAARGSELEAAAS